MQIGGTKMQDEINFIKQNYALSVNVSIAALVNASGRQDNYVRENINGSKTYINETNAFGSGERLKFNSIILYIYLHFLGPNQNAHVLIDIDEASRYLSISKRTILNNLNILYRKEYIAFTEGILEGTYDVFLEYYSDNGVKASNSGRGYLAISQEIFQNLLKLRNTNMLRLALRSCLSTIPGKQNIGMETGCTLSSIKRLFPSYVKRKDIFEMFSNKLIQRILDIKVALSKKYCTIKVKTSYNPTNKRNSIITDAQSKLSSLFESLNLKHPYNQFKPDGKEMVDISKIALRVPLKSIETAIRKLYYNYTRAEVKNLPALIRTLAPE